MTRESPDSRLQALLADVGPLTASPPALDLRLAEELLDGLVADLQGGSPPPAPARPTGPPRMPIAGDEFELDSDPPLALEPPPGADNQEVITPPQMLRPPPLPFDPMAEAVSAAASRAASTSKPPALPTNEYDILLSEEDIIDVEATIEDLPPGRISLTSLLED